MEFIIPTSIVSIIVALFLAVFIGFQVIIDSIDVRRSRNLYRQMITLAKKQSELKISVVIELSKDAESIIPLLDHLYGQRYDKLEVVVILKPTAHKNSYSLISHYRRVNQEKNLRIVNQKKEQKITKILRRYSTGSQIIFLDNTMRLSTDFFTYASLESQFRSDTVIIPRRYTRLGNTVTSALQAHSNILNQLKLYFTNQKPTLRPFQSGIIYTRKALLSEDELIRSGLQFTSQRLFISDIAPIKSLLPYFKKSVIEASKLLQSVYGFGLFVAVVAAVVAISLLLGYDQLLIITIFTVVLYTLVSVTAQTRVKGYYLFDHINLILVAPLNLIITTVVYSIGFVKMVIDTILIYRRARRLGHS